MKIHKGRLIDHIHIEVADLKKSRHFYESVLGVFGIDIAGEGEGFFVADELFVSSWGGTPSRIHLAFQAADESVVKKFHETGLKAGGVDHGPPGERKYHPDYFAAYLLDPDGNNVEAVFHGPAQRSAASIIIEPNS